MQFQDDHHNPPYNKFGTAEDNAGYDPHSEDYPTQAELDGPPSYRQAVRTAVT
jgi:hypothetical protein